MLVEVASVSITVTANLIAILPLTNLHAFSKEKKLLKKLSSRSAMSSITIFCLLVNTEKFFSKIRSIVFLSATQGPSVLQLPDVQLFVRFSEMCRS